MASILPPDFASLEPFADWAIPTERARYAKRVSSSMDELQAFYDAAFPRLEAAASYLQKVQLDTIAEDDKTPSAPATSIAATRSGSGTAGIRTSEISYVGPAPFLRFVGSSTPSCRANPKRRPSGGCRRG